MFSRRYFVLAIIDCGEIPEAEPIRMMMGSTMANPTDGYGEIFGSSPEPLYGRISPSLSFRTVGKMMHPS